MFILQQLLAYFFQNQKCFDRSNSTSIFGSNGSFCGSSSLVLGIWIEIPHEVGFNKSLYTDSKQIPQRFLLLHVFNSFLKQTLKFFLLLPTNQTFVLVKFFIFEHHIPKYLTMGGKCQDHIDNNNFLLRCLLFKHHFSYVLMRTIVNFMFNKLQMKHGR